MTPPTLIISPMIKKWREEQAKKNMPMASEEEMASEAPGLKVGVGAWKWPPVWPYDQDFFSRMGDEAADPTVQNSMSSIMGSMTGNLVTMPQAPSEGKKLDSVEYWSVENAEVLTEIDSGAAASIRNHYSYHLKDGMNVLELGAAEESYLPETLQLNEHIGVGLTPKLMERNSKLTQRLVVDLNKVQPGEGVDSDELYALGANRFDAIIMANTIDFLTDSREVYRSAWRLLKPGGIMICPFVSKDAYVSKFEKGQTRMWRQFNDDQHMYVCGSFFHFSAAQGWDGLTGFDITPPEAKDQGFLSGILNPNKPMKAFAVQARKKALPDEIDESNPAQSFEALMSLTPVLESRDKILLAPRLARTYEMCKSEEKKSNIKGNIDKLPKVYESLVKMDQFTFSFNLQSQLAAEVICDPSFVANDEQIEALNMGLGLRTPSKDFWAPVGRLTSQMKPEDKVSLLSYIVPRFGSGDEMQDEALQAFVTALKPTFEVIQAKCPEMTRADVELVGTEALAAEILTPGRSTREEFAKWLGSMTAADIEDLLAKRKSYNDKAAEELRAMREGREEEKRRREEEMKQYQQQIQRAREERTLVLNEKTGKMEYVEKKK